MSFRRLIRLDILAENDTLYEKLFQQSQGKPIQNRGDTLHILDSVDVPKLFELRLSVLSCDSSWRQGVKLETKGRFDIAGMAIGKSIVLWYDTLPSSIVNMRIESKS